VQVPLLDLKRQYQSIKEEIDSAIQRVLESQQFILGEEVENFENEIADYCGTKHAIGVASGTDAIKLALQAAGVGEGENDKVITTPFTYFATAGSIVNAGAEPVFVDIKPDTFNIDPDEVRKLLEGKKEAPNSPQATGHKPQANKSTNHSPLTDVKAIIPVHLYGQMADMDPIMQIAEEYDLVVVEDAAQAIGATYQSSLDSEGSPNTDVSLQATGHKPQASNSTNHSPLTKKAGSIAHLGCFSFFPTKNLGGYGDGGMVVTDDDELAEKVRMLRVHGSKEKYFNEIVGHNSRLDALQAAVLSTKLPYLDEWSKARAENAKEYNENLNDISEITTPKVENGRNHIYHQYTIRVGNSKRDKLQSYLQENDIGRKIYYPLSLHLQGCFERLGYSKGDFLNAEKVSEEVLSLPIFPELTRQEIKYVENTISDFFDSF